MNYFQQKISEWSARKWEKMEHKRDCVIKIIEQKSNEKKKKTLASWMRRKIAKIPIWIGIAIFLLSFSFSVYWVCACVIVSMCKTAGSNGTGTRNAKLLFLSVFRCHWNGIDSFRSTWIPARTLQLNKLNCGCSITHTRSL